MARNYQFVPSSVLQKEQRIEQAGAFRQAQRQRVANLFRQHWQANIDALDQEFGAQLRAASPAPALTPRQRGFASPAQAARSTLETMPQTVQEPSATPPAAPAPAAPPAEPELTPRQRGFANIQQAARAAVEEAPAALQEPAEAPGQRFVQDVAETATAFVPPIGVPEEEARRRAMRLGQIAEAARAPLDPSTMITSALERAGVPGHEEFGFEAGPVQVGPRELLGFAAGMAVPGGEGRVQAAGRAAQAAVKPAAKAAGRLLENLNIRLDKYPEEVREIIQTAFEANIPESTVARRGVIPDEQVEKLAQLAGTTVNRVIRQWKPGQAKNAETILALRNSLALQSERVRQAHEAFKQADTTDNFNRLLEEITKQRAVQEVVEGVTAEAGRALRQFRQPVTGEHAATVRLRQFLKLTNSPLDETDLRDVLRKTNFEDPLQAASAVKELFQPTFKDKAIALWYFNLLSSPVTHVRNTVSNALTAVALPVESAFAAGADIARVGAGRALGRPARRERFLGEAGQQAAGLVAGITEGLGHAAAIMRRGFTEGEVSHKLDIATREPFKGPLADLTLNVPGRLLRASDVLFRTMNRTAAIYGEAYRLARQEGLRGHALAERMQELRRAPTEEMLKEAESLAAYRVFQAPGGFAEDVARLRTRQPWLRLLLPFVQTPINIMKFAAERSPAGVIGIGLDALTAGGRARLSGGNLSDRLGRASLGSVILGGLYTYAQTGNLTAAAPRDPTERDAFFRQGKQPYSIKLGDTWYSYQALQPFSALFAAAATAAEAQRRGQDQDALSLFTLVSLGVGRSLVDMPWTEGLARFLERMHEFDVTQASPLDEVGDYVGRNAQSLVPAASFWRWVARASDATLRDPRSPVETVLSGLPGAQALVPPRQTAFGQPVQRPSVGFNPLAAAFSPSQATQDPVEQELARLQVRGYEVQPGFVGRVLTELGQPVRLTREEHETYQRLAGQLAYALLLADVTSPGWASLPDDVKARMVERYVQVGRDYARNAIRPALQRRALESLLPRRAAPAGAAP